MAFHNERSLSLLGTYDSETRLFSFKRKAPWLDYFAQSFRKDEKDSEKNNIIRSVGIFQGKQVVIELSTTEGSKLKAALRKKILDNGGQLSYIVTKDTDLLICGKKETSQVKLNAARRYDIPVVSFEYVDDCLDRGILLPVDPFLVDHRHRLQAFKEGKIAYQQQKPAMLTSKVTVPIELQKIDDDALKSYQLVKYVLLKGASKYPSTKQLKGEEYYRFATLEIHAQIPAGSREMCVFIHEGEVRNGIEAEVKAKTLGQFVHTAREALSLYGNLFQKLTGPPKFLRAYSKPFHNAVGSRSLQSLFKSLLMSTDNLDPGVLYLVNLCFEETKGFLSQYLENPNELVPEWKAREAQKILIQMAVASTKFFKNQNNLVERLSKDFYKLITYKSDHAATVLTPRGLLSRFQVCHLLINIASLIENGTSLNPLYSIYSSLNCEVFNLKPTTKEFKEIQEYVISSQTCDVDLKIHKIFSIKRNLDSAAFTDKLTNPKLLFHGTLSFNILSILSNGLRPLISTITKGYGSENFDLNALGFGIYFTETINGSLKYCLPSTAGTRYVFVSKVALGNIYETHDAEPSFPGPPPGYDSVLGVKASDAQPSFFQENEFIIYNENQQELCYLVEFSLTSEEVRIPEVKPIEEIPVGRYLLHESHEKTEIEPYLIEENYEQPEEAKRTFCNLKRVDNLMSGSTSDFPLEGTHIRARVLDLVAKVSVFQVYRNNSETSCEVRYTFPLSGGAAVCGFEAFIGTKHVIGEVKEKETAHEEYREAVSQGHGAYLLDEENPNVFTARLGNLPANTRAIIKITYIVELTVESDTLKLILPASICTLEDKRLSCESAMDFLTFEASIEMATNIQSVYSPTHPIHVKTSDTKAVVKLPSDCKWNNGIVVSVRMCEVHIPRMWVEKHPEKDTEVCMVTYYPQFEDHYVSKKTELILLLDASNAMKGQPFQTALSLIIMCLKNIKRDVRFNIIAFGSIFTELFPESQELNEKTRTLAMHFLKRTLPDLGKNDIMPPLNSCNIFRTSAKTNVFLISNGYFQSEDQLCGFVSQLQHVRLFSLAVGEKSNRHFLKRSANLSGGSFEEYLSAEKEKWESKLNDQILKTSRLSLTNIDIEWQQFDEEETRIVVAPQKFKSLFSGSFLIAYGFVTNCTVATLKAKIGKEEYKTVVHASKLNHLSGTLIHSLAAKARIDDWETGIFEDRDEVQAAKREDLREEIIELAKEFSLVSSLTSFIAIEKRREDEVITEGPCLEKLLHECDVDVLPYISFDSNKTDLEKVLEKNADDGSFRKQKISDEMVEQCDFDTLQSDEIDSVKKKKRKSRKTENVVDSFKIGFGSPRSLISDDSDNLPSAKFKNFACRRRLCRAPTVPISELQTPPPGSISTALADAPTGDSYFSQLPKGSSLEQSASRFPSLFNLPNQQQIRFFGIRAPPVFGSQAPPVPGSLAPPVLGSQAPPVFGSQAPPVFGSQAPPVFGSQAPSVFASQAASNFASQAPTAFGFQVPTAFGSQVPTAFGSPVLTALGSQAPSVFDSQTPHGFDSQASLVFSSLEAPVCSLGAFEKSANLNDFEEELGVSYCFSSSRCARRKPVNKSVSEDGSRNDLAFGFLAPCPVFMEALGWGIADTPKDVQIFCLELVKGETNPVVVDDARHAKLAPVLQGFLCAISEKEVSGNYEDVLNIFTDTFANFGGGAPLCGMFLKELRKVYQQDFQVDILTFYKKIDASILENFSSDSSENDNTDLHDQQFVLKVQDCLSNFVEKMETAGLNSMGSAIHKHSCDLASLVHIVYCYFLKFLFPAALNDDALDKGFDYESVIRLAVQYFTSEIESWEIVMLLSCLIRIHTLDEKYPLIYSTLELGSSWENALFEDVLKVL